MAAVRFTVRLIPKAGCDAFSGWAQAPNKSRLLKARVSAPREGGKANEVLIRLLATKLRVGRSSIEIISGAASRTKIIEVHGLTSLPAGFGEKL